MHLFLIDPVVLSRLPALNLLLTEPEGDLLLRRVDSIGAMADIASDIDGEVAANGAWRRGERVGGTEESAASLDDVFAFPDHGTHWAAAHVYTQLALPSAKR